MSGDQDPGQAAPSSLDSLVQSALEIGAQGAQREEISEALGGIASRRRSLETGLEAQIADLRAAHEESLGALDTEEASLTKQLSDQEEAKRSAQGKVNRLSGRLRVLAADPDADRATVRAFAAFDTSGDHFTSQSLDRITLLDETVRTSGGEVFVASQVDRLGGGTHTAFGKIHEGNAGLIISTDKDLPPTRRPREYESIRRVKLPVQTYNIDGAIIDTPAYGWVSTEYDGRSDYNHDTIEGHSDDPEEVFDQGGDYATCRFNMTESDLHLLAPADTLVVPTVGSVTDAESPLDRFFVGAAALEYLHIFVSERLAHINSELGHMSEDAVGLEYSRLSRIALKLGIDINPSKVPNLDQLLG